MNDAELDDSWMVSGLTLLLYVGWLSVLAAVALWLGVEPLPSVQARFPGPAGTVAALAVGVAFIAVSRWVYDQLRQRFRAPDAVSSEDPPAAVEAPEPPKPKRKKGKRKKKRR